MRICNFIVAGLLLISTAALAGYPSGFSGNALGGYSGYTQGSGTFTSVQATWRIPSVRLDPGVPGVQDLMYQWVGIYGTKLIQTGIQEIVHTDGSVALEAWYECYNDFNIVAFGSTPQMGDVVTASVTCTANCTFQAAGQTWTAVVQDITQNWTATQTGITCVTGLQNVYPGIIETNANGGSILQYSDIPFTNITINGSNPNLGTSNELYGFAHGGGASTATSNPSDPNSTTNGFKLSWGQGDTGQTGTTGYTNAPNTPTLNNVAGKNY